MSRFVFAIAAIVVGLGCTKKSDAPKKEREVSLAIWSNYLSPEVQEKFTKATGIKIRVSNYASNEELLAKIQAGASGIDVAVPSDYMVEILAKSELLQPLDLAKIPNRSGLDAAVLKQEYDPENKYSLPYAWSTAGIAVNRDLYKGPLKSWKDFFAIKELDGKISMLDDVREATAAALKMHGLSVNSTDAKDLEKAKATLKDARKRVKMFRSDTIDPLINKEIIAAQAFSSDALTAAQKSNGAIEYILPEDGGTRAIDNTVVLKSAKNTEEAHLLINFLLSPEANVAFVRQALGGPVVTATKDLLPENLKGNASLFPTAATLAKFERIRDVGPATKIYERIWTEVKSE